MRSKQGAELISRGVDPARLIKGRMTLHSDTRVLPSVQGSRAIVAWANEEPLPDFHGRPYLGSLSIEHLHIIETAPGWNRCARSETTSWTWIGGGQPQLLNPSKACSIRSGHRSSGHKMPLLVDQCPGHALRTMGEAGSLMCLERCQRALRDSEAGRGPKKNADARGCLR